MTKTIWKFPFLIGDTVVFDMSRGAEVVHLALDPQGRLCIWALVDPDAPRERRVFHVYGTGHPIERVEDLMHVGSFVDWSFVWHVFEKRGR